MLIITRGFTAILNRPSSFHRIVRTGLCLALAALGMMLAAELLSPVSAAAIAEFPNPAGAFNSGGQAIDSSVGLIYAQIPEGTAQFTAVPPINPATPPAPQASSVAPPILHLVASDHLGVPARLQRPESFAGKILSCKTASATFSS